MNNYFIVNKHGKALSMFEANNGAKLHFRANDCISFSTIDEAEKKLVRIQGCASINPRIKDLHIATYPDGQSPL